MVKELLYKWFGLDPILCATCEVLREQLQKSEAERRDLLIRLLDKDKAEPTSAEDAQPVPIQPQFIPWRVKQQMLEQEDRKKAQLMRQKADEIAALEAEMGVADASQ